MDGLIEIRIQIGRSNWNKNFTVDDHEISKFKFKVDGQLEIKLKSGRELFHQKYLLQYGEIAPLVMNKQFYIRNHSLNSSSIHFSHMWKIVFLLMIYSRLVDFSMDTWLNILSQVKMGSKMNDFEAKMYDSETKK